MRKLIALSLVIVATLVACNSTPKKTAKDKTAETTEKSACCATEKKDACCSKAKQETSSDCTTCPKAGTSSCCSKTTEKKTSCCSTKESKVTAYYFHNTRRCATCKAVETVATEALKADNICLKSINLEEAEGKSLAGTLKVSGQTLLIVAGEKQENLTNFAFLNARSNPELLKTKIKATVKELNK